MAIQPNQPQGIGGVLDTAFHLYKATLAKVWPISLLLAVVSVVPGVYMLFTGIPGFDPESPAMANPFAMYTPTFIVLSLIFAVLSIWVSGALFLKQRALGVDDALDTGAAFQLALSRLPALVGATILYIIAISVGFVLLLVPGFILMLSLIMNMPLVLFDNKGPIDSLVGSHKLVWGNWWRTCAVVTVMGILLIVLFIAVGFVIGLATPFFGIVLADLVMVVTIVQLVVNALFYVVLGPFMSAVMIALYWDLKLRKEGGDLAARVNALSAA
jgi:hypothetical protein